MKFLGILISVAFLGGPIMHAQLIQPVNPQNPTALIKTSLGEITVELFVDKSPVTASNFIKLANKGFYNGLIFHRVIDNFMIQTGDPNGNGTGGPGYTIRDEFSSRLKHSQAGVLSMANAGPNTGGSQFFITLAPTTWLDGKHAIFGQVIRGMDIVRKIGRVKVDLNDRPIQPVKMEKVFIMVPKQQQRQQKKVEK
ncbi:peptidyl-prolyl cis-trans isomerase A (cyclophilin A) [Brevinema andersonii]|uniref:Peptidyl-prolyl cis-trans isomerase n=2 Tax=Brevinema andersonii TaxID=34097 RepID=A0A1I1EAJ5_BREAD|nr:peptidylprolyl isomerase [Brevinema andersonii]SFB84139.1 peptidyl-prolyl cis-trans isomerase A (cyclophilin A) [Brevinema andersonii]